MVLALTLAFGASAVGAGDWPRYRGAENNGISAEKGWSVAWAAEGPKVLWNLSVGTGASSVSVSQGRLFTMGNEGDQDIVHCLDAASGKQLWRHTYPCPLDRRQFEGGPGATPTVDGNLVYTLSHQGHLFCLDATSGKVIWRKHLIKDLGGQRSRWGYACSPLVEGNMLIVDNGGRGASTLALNKLNGNVIWRSGDDYAGYASPVVFNLGSVRCVVVFKASTVVGLNVANGQELWRHPWKTSYDVNAATPIASGNEVFVTSGYGAGCGLVRIITGRAMEQWRNKAIRAHFNTPVLWNGHIYGVDGNAGSGSVVCLDFKTGAEKWRQDGIGCGSLMLADDKLIVLGETGELIVCKAQPTRFESLASAKVLDGRCWVVPVLANAKLYCRNNQGSLVCLDLSGK
jgi:outer membrane protein assembly factor BamB